VAYADLITFPYRVDTVVIDQALLNYRCGGSVGMMITFAFIELTLHNTQFENSPTSLFSL